VKTLRFAGGGRLKAGVKTFTQNFFEIKIVLFWIFFFEKLDENHFFCDNPY